MRIIYKVTRVVIIINFILFLSSCRDVDTSELRLFYPRTLPESNFKNLGINRITGIDVDQYLIRRGDTTFTYEYQQGSLEAIYWEFPCNSYDQLLKILDDNNQMVICSEGVNRKKVIIENMVTRHMFWCSVNHSDSSVLVTYDVIR